MISRGGRTVKEATGFPGFPLSPVRQLRGCVNRRVAGHRCCSRAAPDRTGYRQTES